MITIKNKVAIRKNGRSRAAYLQRLCDDVAAIIKPGITTLILIHGLTEQLAERELVSQTKGYHGYQHVSCISVNDEVVHGVPKEKKLLKRVIWLKLIYVLHGKDIVLIWLVSFLWDKPTVEQQNWYDVAQACS